MKRKIYPMVLIVAVVILGQSCSVEFFRSLSPEAGIHSTNIAGESTSYKPTIGGHVGVSLPVASFGDAFKIIAGINGSLQGAKWDDYGYGGTVSLIYANVPVLGRYSLKNGFFGEAGIQPGFLLSAKDKYSGESYDYKDQVNTFDIGIPLGVGYNFKNNIGVGVRMTRGLSNINKEGDSKDHNFVIGLRASYTFGKK